MAVHDEVLAAARRLAAERSDWTFTPEEVVRALPHLHPGTIRTHVTSRCCVNAPVNHVHRWKYFERVARGRYRLLPAVRGKRSQAAAEERAEYVVEARRESIHGVVSRSGKFFVAECLEIPVVTQGRTLDEVVGNLKEAVALHLEGEDMAALGFAGLVRLVLTFDIDLRVSTA